MLQRFSFHPPHDADKVVISEEHNQYFSRPNSFMVPTARPFELVESEIDAAFNNDNKRNRLQIPDLVLSLDEPDNEISFDKTDVENKPIVRDRVFYRKPSQYVRPKLSLVEEEDDDDDQNCTATSSLRSSVRSSVVIHHDFDNE